MGHSKNKLTIRILSIISAISILSLCIYVPDAPAKADGGGFQFLYTLSQYEYLHEIDQTDPLYNPNNIRQEFCNFVRFVDWNSSIDYSSSIEDFATFLNSDTTFQSLDFEQYKVICFNSKSYTQTEVLVYTSPRPLYVTNSYIYSYELNNSNSFSFKKYTLTYSHDNMSMTNISYLSSGTIQNISYGQLVNNTYFIGGYDNQFDFSRGHIVYSDCPVRFGYDSSSPGIDNSGDASCTANQLFTANEDGFSIYPVLAIDRRTCCPSWVDTSMSPDDRYISEHSRCGFKNVYYYVGGDPENLSNNIGYIPNEYLRVNKSHCALKLYFNLQCNGQFEALKNKINDALAYKYKNKYGSLYEPDKQWMSNWSYDGQYHILTIPLDDITENAWNTYTIGTANYFNEVYVDGIYAKDPEGEDVVPTVNEWFYGLSAVFSYSFSNTQNVGLSWKIQGTYGSGENYGSITALNYIAYLQICDLNDSTKDSGLAQINYDCINGKSTNTTDPVVYDDTDIIDRKDDPDYTVPTHPTTETDPTQPTTQTVVVDGGKNSVVVTNTNNNTNNPTFNNTPSVNVTVSGGGSDSTETDGLIVIKDDDNVEFEDVQDVMDGVENFLDFGDTYFDEYIGTLLSVIPTEVWRPFAISSAFIALACMIGYILRR